MHVVPDGTAVAGVAAVNAEVAPEGRAAAPGVFREELRRECVEVEDILDTEFVRNLRPGSQLLSTEYERPRG